MAGLEYKKTRDVPATDKIVHVIKIERALGGVTDYLDQNFA